MLTTEPMTIIDILAVRREAGARMRRRRFVFARLAGFLCRTFLVLGIWWCFTSREELLRMLTGMLAR